MVTLFHGSSTDNITTLEPRTRYVPAGDTASPPSVYATDIPAYASAHAFDWETKDGVDLYLEEGRVILIVPKILEERLKKPIFIYTVPAITFTAVTSDSMGHNFRSTEPVKCVAKQRFESVTEAITSLGGIIKIKEAQ